MAVPAAGNPLDPLRPIGPEPVPSSGPEKVPLIKPPQEKVQEWRARWEEMRKRVRQPVHDARRDLARELSHNADQMKIRARHYHQHRPLHVLGVIAAAGFALGLVLGFWRR